MYLTLPTGRRYSLEALGRKQIGRRRENVSRVRTCFALQWRSCVDYPWQVQPERVLHLMDLSWS